MNISLTEDTHAWRSPSRLPNKAHPLIFQAQREMNNCGQQGKTKTASSFFMLKVFLETCALLYSRREKLTFDFTLSGRRLCGHREGKQWCKNITVLIHLQG